MKVKLDENLGALGAVFPRRHSGAAFGSPRSTGSASTRETSKWRSAAALADAIARLEELALEGRRTTCCGNWAALLTDFAPSRVETSPAGDGAPDRFVSRPQFSDPAVTPNA